MADNNLYPSPQPTAGADQVSAPERSYQIKLGAVLQDILDAGLPGGSVLFLRSDNGAIDGRVLIVDSCLIVAAVNRKRAGNDALKQLMSVTHGTYKWSHSDEDLSLHFQRNLNVQIQSIIPTVPWRLEDIGGELYEESLMDGTPRRALSSCKSYTTLHSIPAITKKQDDAIKLPKELRERLVNGVSLAHSVERNFETVSSINIKRLEARKRSFEVAKSNSLLVPINVAIGALMVIAAGFAIWIVFDRWLSPFLTAHLFAPQQTQSVRHDLKKGVRRPHGR